MKILWDIFFMFGGVAAMLIGMKTLGNALEQVAGSGMKKLLAKATTNRFAGVGTGIVVTSIIQSSTATTVMLVGFVNIGLMSLVQASNVIMGANIGTTVTAHIVSLSGVGEIDIGAIAAVIGCVGMLMSMLINNKKVEQIGNLLAGLGLIFVGLEFISSHAKAIMFLDGKPHTWVKLIFQVEHFPLLLIVIGIILTALVHSSSTITSLMVVLAGLDVLSFENALFLTLGSNIGTCITAIMAGAGTCANARRTGIVHLLFNTIGCLIFLAPIWIFKAEITQAFNAIAPNEVGVQLAVFHTVFNLITTIVLLPFIKYVVKIACLIVPDKQPQLDDRFKFQFIDERLLQTPPVAVGNTKNEIIRMFEFAIANINYSVEMLLDKDKNNEQIIREQEEVINHFNKEITAYLTKLMGKDLSDEDDKKIGSYYHVVSDVERVGDYAENILEYALKLREEGCSISEEAKEELKQLNGMINDIYKTAIKAFDERNVDLLPSVDAIEEEIDQYSQKLEDYHIERVKQSLCNAQVGSIYLQTVSNLERVGDHITNVALSIKHYRHSHLKNENN